MNITIKDKEIKLKKTFRSVIAYEQAMKEPFNPKTLTETIMYFYCVVIASDQSLEITYDEFIDWLDENETAFKEFTEWLVKVSDMESTTAKKESKEVDDKVVTYTELLQMVVIQFGVCSMEYFLDKMKPYELSIICESLHLRVKDSWEQTRMISYLIAQTNSKKKLKPNDIISFPWEKEKTVKKAEVKPLTLEDVETIKALALEREKKLKEKGII